MTTPEELLKEVESRLGELDSIDKEIDDCQNIIGLLGKGHDEVSFCKILWYILNLSTNGKKEYLASFLNTVLAMTDLVKTEIDKAFVYREYYIPDSGRRIDLVIKTPSHFIPIEAKIYSEEHGDQCSDYLKYSQRFYRNPQEASIYYLTIDGKMPSEDSCSNNSSIKDRIKCISWTAILNWLTDVKTMHSDHCEVIGQFYKALALLLNPQKEEFEMNIDNSLINSSADIRAALIIEEAIDRKKIALIHDIFEGIREALEDDDRFDLDHILNKSWNNEKRIKEYYDQKKSSYPGLNYNLGSLGTDDTGKEYYFVLRFEIDYHAFVGYGIWTVDKNNNLEPLNNPSDALLAKIKALIPGKNLPSIGKDWWIDWEYIFSNNKDVNEAGPNFKDMNEYYIALYDKEPKEEFIKKAVDCLKKTRSSIVSPLTSSNSPRS